MPIGTNDWDVCRNLSTRRKKLDFFPPISVLFLCHLCISSSEWNGFFNWTMTFRTDSDFYTPYGRIEASSNLPENLDQHIQVIKSEKVKNHEKSFDMNFD